MADKKVPQEPCMFCHHNPCDCGKPVTRKSVLTLRVNAATKEVVTDGSDESAESDD